VREATVSSGECCARCWRRAEASACGYVAAFRALRHSAPHAHGGRFQAKAAVRGTSGALDVRMRDACSAGPAFSWEALASEVGPHGIRVLIVEPGAFRTGVLGERTHSSRELPAYAETAGAMRAAIAALAGAEPGDPHKLAAAIVAAVEAPDAPLRLALGADAVDAIRAAHDRRRADLDAWEHVSRGTTMTEPLPLWNGALTHEASVVVPCRTAHDVRGALERTRAEGLPASVLGGGHDWAGRACRPCPR
jgi:hypothetical protein